MTQKAFVVWKMSTVDDQQMLEWFWRLGPSGKDEMLWMTWRLPLAITPRSKMLTIQLVSVALGTLLWMIARRALDAAGSMEARVGIEPTHKGFADLSLTTWVPRLKRAVHVIDPANCR